ncbi:MAG: RNA-binding protein [Deltaproteobacteria bacterium]|nr:RNA-binding protein [Deltaproteobacteria bacterium]
MQTKLYVGNLDRSVTNEDLKTLFSHHGEVREAKLIEGKGFGFVEMSNQIEAESAKKVLNGSDFKGRKLKVDIAQPPKYKSRGHRYR